MGKKFDYETTAKSFTNMLKNWQDVIHERNLLTISAMDNERKMKQNFMWKVIEGNVERQQKLKFIKEAQAQFGQGNQENGDMGLSTPQMRVGAGGEPTLHYESPTEKEKRIQNGYRQIETQRLAGKPLTPAMERFLEKYPEDVWRKEEIDKNKITPSQALNIISDPFKSQQLKRYYPELYKKIESIAKQEKVQIIDTETPPLLPEQKSPYPEYPDAFLENGIWKVMQNGKKYKIQE